MTQHSIEEEKYANLSNKIFGVFHQAFRNVGISFDIKQAESLRDTTKNIATAIVFTAHSTAKDITKALETSTRKALGLVADDLSSFEQRLEKLEKKIENLEQGDNDEKRS